VDYLDGPTRRVQRVVLSFFCAVDLDGHEARMRGATMAILLLNSGIILVLRGIPQDPHRLVMLQLN